MTVASDVRIRNTRAVCCRSGSAFLFSFVPLAISLGGVAASPFLFNAGLMAGLSCCCFLYVLVFHRSLVFNRQTWRMVLPALSSRVFLVSCLFSLEYGLFAWSTRYIDVSISTVLFEVAPVIVIILMSRLFPHDYRRNLRFLLPLMAISFLGMVLAVLSQTGEFFLSGSSWLHLAVGVLLVVLGAFATSTMAFGFLWGRRLAAGLPVGRSDGRMFGVVVCAAFVSLFGAVLNGGIGFLSGETISPPVLLVGVFSGFGIYGFGTILFRKANLLTDNLGINVIAYAAPVLSLVWLSAFGLIGVARLDWLLWGGALILGANLLVGLGFRRPRVLP